MMKTGNHSFAILAYKESPYLEECIISLTKQSIKSDIYISTSTPSEFITDLAQKYNIPVKVNSISAGIASDWSFAYKNCLTPYVTLAHQDDIYLPDYTEKCLSAANKCSQCSMIFTDYSELVNGKTIHNTLSFLVKRIILTPYLFTSCLRSGFMKRSILSLGNPVSCPTVTYNKDHIGKFEFTGGLLCSLDWDTWLRISALNGCMTYVRKRLVYHRIHSGSEAYIQTSNYTRFKEDEVILRRMWPGFMARFFTFIHTLFIK